ncbi:MAG: hypothetical protein GXX99_02270 [Clostridiales bacterium]|nr:hypothetical protein [Clostridiales bacterium]
MRINNNITAMNAHRQYGINNANIAKNVEKLSSGYRINRAGDDAAGLAISEKMRAQIRGLQMASKNSQDAISLVQTAEGALQSTHNILQRMRELAVQSGSDTNEQSIDRGALEQEFMQLRDEINETASKTRFNDQNLIDGYFAGKRNIGGATGAMAADSPSIFLANNAKAGNYAIDIVQVTTGAVVAEAPTYVTDSADVAAAVGANADFTISGAINANALYNGTWEIRGNADGTLSAVNLTTGVSVAGSFTEADLAANGTATVNFTGLGDFTFEVKDAVNLGTLTGRQTLANNLTNSTFALGGAKDYNAGTTKFYATCLGAERVEVKVGDDHVTFNNGITVKLGTALSAADLAKVTDTGADGLEHADDANFVKPDKLQGIIEVKSVEGRALVIQTGANQGDELAINVDKMDSYALGIGFSSVRTREGASKAITEVNGAINQVSTQRAALGALQNRLEFKIANLDTSAENLSAAESRIRDVDMAKEMTQFTRNNILAQASTAMLAQANALPQGVLQLLG